jgi:hypothetical protein
MGHRSIDERTRSYSNQSLFSEQKRTIHAGNGNRDEFNRQEHSAYDGLRRGGREDEIQTEKLRGLRRRCLPWREQHGQDQHDDHSVEYREIELIWRRSARGLSSRPTIRSIGEPPTALDTETVDLRL